LAIVEDKKNTTTTLVINVESRTTGIKTYKIGKKCKEKELGHIP
jgi:hypothetical protein